MPNTDVTPASDMEMITKGHLTQAKVEKPLTAVLHGQSRKRSGMTLGTAIVEAQWGSPELPATTVVPCMQMQVPG